MEWILCRVVESSCLPFHNIVPHISWHDLPYRKTTKKYKNSPSMVVSPLSPRKFFFECTPSIRDKKRCWFSQIDFFIKYSTSEQYFVSFQPIFMSSTYTDKSDPFSRCTNKQSQLETFSHPCFNRIFSNCLSHHSPAKG